MNKNIVLGIAAVALGAAAFYVLRSDGAKDPEAAERHDPVRAAVPTPRSPSGDNSDPRGSRSDLVDDPPTDELPKDRNRIGKGVEIPQSAVIVAKEDFEDALDGLDEVDATADPEAVALAIRDATRALSRFEEESDPDDPLHRRLHTEAVRKLQRKLKGFSRKEGYPANDQ